MIGLYRYDLHRISGGAVNLADLRASFHRIENIDRISIPHQDYESVSGPQAPAFSAAVFFRESSFPSTRIRQWPRRLAKCDAEFRVGTGGDHDFVEIFRGLDEVALSKNDVAPLGYLRAAPV